MRTIVFILLAVMLQSCASGQLPPKREIDKDFRNTFSEMRKDAFTEVDEAQQDGWDIVLDPIERVPTNYVTSMDMALELANWGERLLLPDALKQRLVDECRFPVVLKIADTGGEQLHPLLEQGQLQGKNYTTSPTLEDIQGHGSHVAGIAVADQFGLLDGLIDKGLVVWHPIKVLNDQGAGSFAWVANMIKAEDADNERLISRGVSVVYNGSFGGGTTMVGSVESALKASTDKGVLYVFASGNDGKSVNYPGRSRYTIATGSLDESLRVSNFSSRGPELDLAAPGRNILSTFKEDGFAELSGTSMASPFLAACVVIAKSRWGDKIEGTEEMKNYLSWIATDLKPDGRDDASGWGIAYVRSILDNDPKDIPSDPTDPVDPPPPTPEPGKVSLVMQTGDHAILYKVSGEKNMRTLVVPELTFQVTGPGPAEELYDKASAYVANWFINRGIVLKTDQGLAEAVFYVGRFLELVADNEGWQIDVIEVSGADREGRTLVERVDRKFYEGSSALGELPELLLNVK
jgi:hypothetical protein